MTLKHKLTTVLIAASVTCLLSGTAYAKATDGVGKEETCYRAGELAYITTTKKDEQKAIAVLDKIINEPNQSYTIVQYVTMVKELAYYGLNKQGVFQGDRLKQLIRSKCLSIHGNYFKE